MRKKLREAAGVTMVEMLAAVAILVLLTLMLNTGMEMMMHSYQTMIAKSEVDLLLSTAVDAIADDLRYARDVEIKTTKVGKCNFTYTSDSFFGKEVYLDLDGDQIVAKHGTEDPKSVLPNGAYGSGAVMTYKEYKVTRLEITANANNTFTIILEVQGDGVDGGKITASTPKKEDGTDIGVTVRCLNPINTTP